MTTTTTTTKTHRYTVEAKPATEAGALDGFAVYCDDCGFIGSSSMKSQAYLLYGEGHKAYMAKAGK